MASITGPVAKIHPALAGPADSKHLLATTRKENFGEWYRAVLEDAELAEPSVVRGCMVIHPWGYGLWEQVQGQMDRMFKEQKCCKNAYFPLFIPIKNFAAEAEHVAGFAKECAVVTHYRMMIDPDTKKMVPDPTAKLEEPLIVRPTSETIIGETMSRKIQSYRDLPLLLNQWCNVVRWEHATIPFLRTTEFLWQEGHCAFATEQEARENAYKMAQVYQAFMTGVCALPVLRGTKSPSERFAGADETWCLEAMMQDGKAVQAGTSHYLGTHFSKAASIRYKDKDNAMQLAQTTSWGVSTRLIGTLIMTHSDDDGLRVPPRLAPFHAVIIPSGHKDTEIRDDFITKVERTLNGEKFAGRDLTVELDNRDAKPAQKSYEWIKKGIPLRLEIGAREAKNEEVTVHRRDMPRGSEPTVVKLDQLGTYMIKMLGEIQQNYYEQALKFQQEHTRTDIKTPEEFTAHFSDPKNIGFVIGKWSGDAAAEKALKDEKKITIRCLLEQQSGTEGICLLTGKPATLDVVFGRSY